MSSLTFSTAEVTKQLGAPSERWVVEQIRAGKFAARKIGRHWRMTEQDVQDALNACINAHAQTPTPRRRGRPAGTAAVASGLTPTSRKKLTAL